MKHNLLKTAALTAAALAVTACQTAAPPAQVSATPQQQLFSSISPSIYDGTLAASNRTAEDLVCAQFYKNSVGYIARNTTSSGAGTGILKTMALGMLAGVASGGVSALGIGSTFLETAAASTANQVVFQGGQAILDGGDDAPASADPMVNVASAAQVIGCPAPTKDILKTAKKALKVKPEG